MRTPSARLVAKELQLELSSEARTLYFHGESMRPFLVEGDAVVVEPVAWDEIRIGDVVTYRVEEKFPTRRVVRRSRNGLFLWCENWPERQFFAPREDLLGRALARRRDGAWITRRDPEWMAARRRALAAYWRRYAVPVSVDAVRRAAQKLSWLAGRRRG
jgi:signal peptidase I